MARQGRDAQFLVCVGDEEMTCIIGLVENGKVYMGGDSILSDGYDCNLARRPKICINGSFLLGSTGSIRMAQLLQYDLTIPDQKEEDDMTFMVRTVVAALREKFKSAGFAKVENSQETGGEFLVGYKGNLYRIQNDFSVLQYQRNFDACGSGEDRALAAMLAFEGTLAKERILKSLEVTAKLCALVAPPFHILELDND